MPITLLRVHRGAVAVLALLTFTASLLLAALPKALEKAYDRALGTVLDASTADVTDLKLEQRPGRLLTTPQEFAERDAQLRHDLPPALREVIASGGTSHYGAQTYGTPVIGRMGERNRPYQFFDLAWLPDADRRVRYVEGSPPGPTGSVMVGGTTLVRFDVAVVKEAADAMGLRVGSTLLIGVSGTMAARVTGFYEIVDPTDGFWEHNRGVSHAAVRWVGETKEYSVTGLTSADSLKHLDSNRDLRYSWVLGIGGGAVTARNAQAVVDDFGVYQAAVARQSGGGTRYVLQSGLPALLTGYLKRLSTAQTLMFLVLGGLGLVALGVIALAAQLLTERMRPALSLMRARGAGLPRIVGTGTAVAALAATPAVLFGYGLAFLVPGPVTPAVHLGPLLPAIAAVAFPAARLALSQREPLRDTRDDVVARRPSPRRIAAEVTVVGLALVGAYLLRARGLTASADGGGDPFLMAVPAALTLATALITLRCYPFPLRLAVRLAARRRRAVPFLGLAQAARARGVTALPVLILLPALAVSVFGSMVSGAIGNTQRLAAWEQVGASARVEGEADIPAATIERVRELPGVEAVVPVAKGTTQVGFGGRTATVVALDLAAYRHIVAGSPLTAPAPPAEVPAPAVPALVSPSLGALTTFEVGWPGRMQATTKGTIEGLPGLAYATDELIVLPYDAAKRAGLREFANTLLIKGEVDRDQLIKVVNTPNTLVTTFDDALREIAGTPLTSTVLRAFTIVTVALAGYALVAVVIALVIGAAERARALSYLRTLGLTQRQARRLTMLEIAPLIVLASLAGLLLGLVLPVALAPGIDLSAYAGLPVDGFPIDLGMPLLLAAGLTTVALLGAFTHAIAGRAVAGALRLGESS
ncbi:membrane protein [Planotetraspora thailandica]|uniref:Membrane protein n=1 Tax=Planotetraspora thailandica TaxID=487172 RepID=A0A8J3Y0G4_9ACTN|nr:FtsX-like permease family protein [Planotetraspora thailandica]GII58519.1 membrane protein [Planotetraspora thailandica]